MDCQDHSVLVSARDLYPSHEGQSSLDTQVLRTLTRREIGLCDMRAMMDWDHHSRSYLKMIVSIKAVLTTFLHADGLHDDLKQDGEGGTDRPATGLSGN